MRLQIILLRSCLAAAVLSIGHALHADEPAVAYTHATIETASKSGRLENATLVVRGGKIEAVGTDVRIPDDAQRIDARGRTIFPGMIDPLREVTIAGGSADAAPRTIVVGGRTITLGGRGGASGGGGFTRLADNFYPYESAYRVLLRSGLTRLNLVTSSYGQSALVRVTPAEPEAMLVNPDGVIFTAVSNESSSLDLVRNSLETAERVKKGESVNLPTGPQPAADAPPTGNRSGRQGGGRRGQRGGGFGGFPRMNAALDQTTLKLWQGVHEGKTPLFVTAANAAAIVHLLKAVEPYKDVKLVISAQGPAIYECLDHLTGKPVRLLIRPGLSLKPNTRDRIDVAKALYDAHLEFAFTHPSSTNDLLALQDFPLFPVSYLVRCGLPRNIALEALTAKPAAMLGLEKTHGTIEPGKTADILVFTGDLLDPTSQLSQVLIEGRTVYEN